jgi:hypothetical protein
MGQSNALLYYRMASRGSVSAMKVSLQDIFSFPDLTAHNIAALCPQAAEYSLHLPLHQCNDKVMRILRFVESECEVLPSKERCPYLVTVEVLEQEFDCRSDMLYAQGMRHAAVSLLRGAAPGQITYKGVTRLTDSNGVVPNNGAHGANAGTMAGSGAEEYMIEDSLTGQASQREGSIDFKAVPVQVVDATTRRSSAYGVARRRGSLLSDNLARAEATKYKRNAVILHHDAESASGAPDSATEATYPDPRDNSRAGNTAHSHAVAAEEHTSGKRSEETCMLSGVELLGAKELRGGQEPSNHNTKRVCDSGPKAPQTHEGTQGTAPASSTRARTWRRSYSATVPEGALRPAHVHEVDLPQLSRSSHQQYSTVVDAEERTPHLHSTGREHLGRPTTRPVSQTLIAQEQHQHHEYQVHQHQQQAQSFRRYVRPKTAEERKAIVRSQSPFGHLPGWNMKSFIVKVGDDLRKEVR